MELRRDQASLFRKFAHLYDSGVPLADALDLARGDLAAPLQDAVGRIVEDIYRGTGLADAMAAHASVFAPEVVGVIRAGELRGELGSAARAAADGIEGRILAAAAVPPSDLDALLERAGDWSVVHVDPDGRLRVRREGVLSGAGEVDAGGLAAGLARRAGIPPTSGTGTFLWNDRLVRVALAGTAVVARIGGPPAPEPDAAAAWRRGGPALLVVEGGSQVERDACLRGILAAFDAGRTKRVAVDLPAPEAVDAPSLEIALSLDPDVVCHGRLRRREDAVLLVEAAGEGVHSLAGASSTRVVAGLPHTLVHLR